MPHQDFMARRFFLFDTPDRFVAGTVGEPGNRTFFLQAREGSRSSRWRSRRCRWPSLAERLDDLLDELEKRGIEGAEDDAGVTRATDGAPLDEPINEAFRAATLSLGWDGSKGRVLVEARAPSEDEDEDVLGRR